MRLCHTTAHTFVQPDLDSRVALHAYVRQTPMQNDVADSPEPSESLKQEDVSKGSAKAPVRRSSTMSERPPMLKATTGVAQACASRPVLRQIILTRWDYKCINSAVNSSQGEIVVQVTGIVQWEIELRR